MTSKELLAQINSDIKSTERSLQRYTKRMSILLSEGPRWLQDENRRQEIYKKHEQDLLNAWNAEFCKDGQGKGATMAPIIYPTEEMNLIDYFETLKDEVAELSTRLKNLWCIEGIKNGISINGNHFYDKLLSYHEELIRAELGEGNVYED